MKHCKENPAIDRQDIFHGHKQNIRYEKQYSYFLRYYQIFWKKTEIYENRVENEGATCETEGTPHLCTWLLMEGQWRSRFSQPLIKKPLSLSPLSLSVKKLLHSDSLPLLLDPGSVLYARFRPDPDSSPCLPPLLLLLLLLSPSHFLAPPESTPEGYLFFLVNT